MLRAVGCETLVVCRVRVVLCCMLFDVCVAGWCMLLCVVGWRVLLFDVDVVVSCLVGCLLLSDVRCVRFGVMHCALFVGCCSLLIVLVDVRCVSLCTVCRVLFVKCCVLCVVC